MVEIEISTEQLKKVFETMKNIRNGVPRVLSPSINRALTHGRTVIRREIRHDYVIKQKDIPINVRHASRETLNGEIVLKQGMLGLEKFKFRPTKPGTKRIVHAQVRQGGGKDIPHGFVAHMQSGLTSVFTRRGRSRLPIRHRVTIGAPIMAAQPHVSEAATREIDASLKKTIEHNIEYVLSRADL